MWLAKNYKAEYHVVDELRGTPTLSNSGLEDKAPPLTLGGLIWHPQNTGPAEKVAESTVSTESDDKKSVKASSGGGGGSKPPKGAVVRPLPGGKKK